MDPTEVKQLQGSPKAEEEKATKEEPQAAPATDAEAMPPTPVRSQENVEPDAEKPSSDRLNSFLSAAKSILSFGESAAGSSVFGTMDSQKSFRRQSTTKMFGISLGFFESKADIRTWGEEHITDPSVQPYDNDATLPSPFHTSLPGYEPRLCQYVLAKGEKAPRDPLLGPEISIYPPTWIPHWEPDPNFKPQPYNFNWEENGSFQMDRLPYVKAMFEPKDGSAHKMYHQAYPYTAYPYGVPRV